ncbi:MAG: hypothetical protein DHS20C18_38960 [Saprospiraceae bacterium]|nr:MAG: hypothetical protein DHS20C18_38960 [Saprospiraceae bacterium]
MDIQKETTIYVKALSNGEWFGGWAPIRARQEWLRADGQVGLFTLNDKKVDEDDEYEYYEVGTQVLGVLEDGAFRVKVGVKIDAAP